MTIPSQAAALLFSLLAVLVPASLTAAAQKAPAQTVVFIGDAATYKWGQPANSSAFQANPKWTNRGLTGRQNSTAIRTRFQTDVVNLHPNVVHILAGAVDISMADTANKPFLLQQFQENLTAMVAQATHAHIKVILGTIPPQLITDNVQQPQSSLVFEPTLILAMNAWIESFGAENNIPVINYHDILCRCVGSTNPGPSGYYPLMGSDGSSPSPAGYTAITELVEIAIATLNLSMNSGRVVHSGNASTITQGQSLAFTAYGFYSDGIPRVLLNTNINGLIGTWSSSNPSVLYIGPNGEAYAYAPGESTINFTTLEGLPFTNSVLTVLPAN